MSDIKPLVSENDWKPGDACHSCGNTDTVWVTDGVLILGAQCNSCGRMDWDEDSGQ